MPKKDYIETGVKSHQHSDLYRGIKYHYGIGVEVDYEEAYNAYEESSLSLAKVLQADLLRDWERAEDYYENCYIEAFRIYSNYQDEIPFAKVRLAYMYSLGLGTYADDTQARDLLASYEAEPGILSEQKTLLCGKSHIEKSIEYDRTEVKQYLANLGIKREFARDLDDSSDEEESEKKLSKRNIFVKETAYRDWIYQKTQDNVGHEKAVEHAFIVQSVGRELLYTQKVNVAYYELKKRLLSVSEPTSFFNKIIHNSIELTTDTFIRAHYEINDDDPSVDIQLKATAIAKAMSAQTSSFFSVDVEWAVELQATRNQTFKTVWDNDPRMQQAVKAASEHLEMLIQKEPMLSMQEAKSLKLDAQTEGEGNVRKAQSELREACFTIAKAYPKDYKRHEKIVLERGKKQGKYTSKDMEENLLALKPKHAVGTVLFPYLESSKKESVLKEHWQACFRETLACVYVRKTLPEHYQFIAKDSTEIRANIRLSNRSQKRAIKNFSANPLLGNHSALRSWAQQIDDDFASKEIHMITAANLARTDKILDFSTYKNIVYEIENLKKKIGPTSLNDKKLVSLVRARMHGTLEEEMAPFLDLHQLHLKALVLELVNLMFICETTRNPSAFIINQMGMDLVDAGKFSWKDMLAKYSFACEDLADRTVTALGATGARKRNEIINSITEKRQVSTFFQNNLSNKIKQLNKLSGTPCESKKKIKELNSNLQEAFPGLPKIVDSISASEGKKEVKAIESLLISHRQIKKELGDLPVTTGGMLPMTPSNAVSSARGLHDQQQEDYQIDGMFPYRYEGETTDQQSTYKTADLIKAEEEIINQWARLKNTTNPKLKIIRNTEDSIDSFYLRKALRVSAAEWYKDEGMKLGTRHIPTIHASISAGHRAESRSHT